ncbi:MAG: DNA gyrase inhibitor YacG [Myxococcaceae bacterium]|nr:DNA gyrase inhibitor YacG [Myxococcaceae bacterium]
MPSPHCPNCKKPVAPRKENPAFPFCSARCRTLDLGRWLGEEYRMPVRQAEEEEDERPGHAPGRDDFGET